MSVFLHILVCIGALLVAIPITIVLVKYVLIPAGLYVRQYFMVFIVPSLALALVFMTLFSFFGWGAGQFTLSAKVGAAVGLMLGVVISQQLFKNKVL